MLKVKFLEVGHGDSSVIYFTEGDTLRETIVIDIPNSNKLYNELYNNNILEIDYIIISHSDSDHCRGLSNFLDQYFKIGKIKNIIFNYDRSNITASLSLMLYRMIEYCKCNKVILCQGIIGDSNIIEKKLYNRVGCNFSLIYPNHADIYEPYVKNNTNNMSIVCYLKGINCNILFTGDLQDSGWKRLLERNHTINCEVLKMPHHGAYWEKEYGLRHIVETLSPKNAIISTKNNNKYKHPDSETINVLKEYNVNIYCTNYTAICDNQLCNSCKCYGDIEVTENNLGYEIHGEIEKKYELKCPQCFNIEN